MWSKINIGTDQYIAKLDHKADDEKCTLWLSNFKSLWSESFADKYVLTDRLAESNPTLNIDDNVAEFLLSQIFDFLRATLDIRFVENEVHVQQKLSEEIENCSFKWMLKKCDSEVFFEVITKPLLNQAGELEAKEKKLLDIIRKKDAEIEQYKLEGAPELTRKKYVTEKFDESTYLQQSKKITFSICDLDGIVEVSPTKPVQSEENISLGIPSCTSKTARQRMPAQQPIPQDIEYDASDDDKDEPVQMKSTNQNAMDIVDRLSPEPMITSPKKAASGKRAKLIKNLL